MTSLNINDDDLLFKCNFSPPPQLRSIKMKIVDALSKIQRCQVPFKLPIGHVQLHADDERGRGQTEVNDGYAGSVNSF